MSFSLHWEQEQGLSTDSKICNPWPLLPQSAITTSYKMFNNNSNARNAVPELWKPLIFSDPKVQCTESCVMVFFSLLSALILLYSYVSRCVILPLMFLALVLLIAWHSHKPKKVGLCFFFFFPLYFFVPEILNLQKWQVMDCSFFWGRDCSLHALLWGRAHTACPSFKNLLSQSGSPGMTNHLWISSTW